jgi:hypothetical protein
MLFDDDWDTGHLQMRTIRETSGSYYPLAERRIQEERNRRCESGLFF